MRKKYLLLIPVVLVLLLVGTVLVYTKVIAADPPERLAFTSSPTTSAAQGATPTTATAAGTGAATGAGAASVDGTWKVTSPSQAGYRARAILFGFAQA